MTEFEDAELSVALVMKMRCGQQWQCFVEALDLCTYMLVVGIPWTTTREHTTR
jgi:hypothetical protein